MVKPNNSKTNKFMEPRINEELHGNYEVRVLIPESESRVMNLQSAKKLADDMDLDLIEVNQYSTPPILKIANYSKWLYEHKKQLKENKQKKTELKEIQLTVNIGHHDLEVKASKAREFIEDGDKVKVVLSMKRREAERREESKKCLYEFIIMLSDVASPESVPKDEGSKSTVILRRKK